MSHHILVYLSIIVLIGVVSQWLAWRLKLSPVLLLLVSGFILGPVVGFLNPTVLFGDLLFPGVSLAVALILFEGGLSLKLSELSEYGRPVFRLLTLGTALTWSMISVLAWLMFQFPLAESILLGAILVVTGPTVIQPLLNHSNPKYSVRTILNWEGIIIDPIGAMLAIIVFEAMHATHIYHTPSLVITTVLKMVLVGTLCGLLLAGIIVVLLKHFWLPDRLQNPFSFAAVIGAFTLANGFQEEAGLVAVTAMGIALANQKFVNIKHIVHFKEDLRVLFLSCLFIILAARLNLDILYQVGLMGCLFVFAVIVCVRPLSVLLSTVHTQLSVRERLFIGAMAPRGIVAAAVSSILVIKLEEAQLVTAATQLIEPLTYAVIIGTVIFYSITASASARWLKVKEKQPNGVLLIGAHPWARKLGKVLQNHGIHVKLIDTNRSNIARARLEGLTTYYGSSLSEQVLQKFNFEGLGFLLALTPNDEVNSLTTLHFHEYFGSSSIYQLTPNRLYRSNKEYISRELSGRYLFRRDLTFESLEHLFEEDNYMIKATPLTHSFSYVDLQRNYHLAAIPLFLIDENRQLHIVSTDGLPIEPKPGHILLSLVPSPAQKAKGTQPLSRFLRAG